MLEDTVNPVVRAAPQALPEFPRMAELPFAEGGRLTQAEFHRLYEQTPDRLRAEPIGRVVYTPSPVK